MSNEAKNKKRNEKVFGPKVTPARAKAFIEYVVNANKRLEKEYEESGKQPKLNVVCLWGRHGIGKTELVHALAKEKGWMIVQENFGEYEEMGDLNGMPQIRDGVTYSCPPAWVPTEEPAEDSAGIFFADDFNRADDRILRGIMRLYQDGGLAGWKLPKRWTIVCSANPEGGEYSVTPIDDAMRTRILSLTMEFNLKEWQTWALTLGNVDPRFVNFTTQYHELAEKGCPRTFVKCAQLLESIEDWKGELGLVSDIVQATLEADLYAEFMKYVSSGMIEIISPDDIMNSSKEKLQAKFNKFLQDCIDKKTGASRKVGPLNVVLTRLSMTLQTIYKDKGEKITAEQGVNIANFIASPEIDSDLRKNFALDVMRIITNAKERDKIMSVQLSGKHNMLYDVIYDSIG